MSNEVLRKARRISGGDRNPFVAASLRRYDASRPHHATLAAAPANAREVAPSTRSAQDNPFLAKLTQPVMKTSSAGNPNLFQHSSPPSSSAPPQLPPYSFAPHPPPTQYRSFPPLPPLPPLPHSSLPSLPPHQSMSYADAVGGRSVRVPVPQFITHGPGSIPPLHPSSLGFVPPPHPHGIGSTSPPQGPGSTPPRTHGSGFIPPAQNVLST